VLTFKEYLLKEFRIPGPRPDPDILPFQVESGREQWFVFEQDNKFVLDKSPCLEDKPACGVFMFSEFPNIKDNPKIFSAAQLELYVQASDPKKSLLHLARGKMVADIDERYRRKFLSQVVDKTVDRLQKIKPSIIVDIDSTADFNKLVLSKYQSSNVIKGNTILKNDFNYIASRYVNPGVVRDKLMQNADYKLSAKLNKVKAPAAIISYAYIDMLKDIRESKDIIKEIKRRNKVVGTQTITGTTKLSIDLIASILASNYTENSIQAFLNEYNPDTRKRNKESYSNEDIAGLIKSLTDSRTIKEFLIPDDFFIFDKSFWQDPANSNIVILDDNINSNKTYIEINKRIKELNPKAQITWVVGIKFLGVNKSSLPKCGTQQQKSLPSEK
jgi:hypothetical protein